MDTQKKEFKEQISVYLMELMDRMKAEHGEDSPEYKALYYQYTFSEQERSHAKEKNLKHYEAAVQDQGNALGFIERLYKRQAVIDITTICSSHCRYCLRQNYDLKQFTNKDIQGVVDYCKNDSYLKEVLITGGDPLIVPKLLIELIEQLIHEVPNLEIIRIGTRLLVHDPLKINPVLFDFFQSIKGKVKIELGLQVNHVVELQLETRNAIKKFQETGVVLYSQNVLLKNINDNLEALVALYDALRYLDVEAHYLFHAVPMVGTSRFRMPIKRGLELVKQLTSSGEISGRIKPMFSLMTDAGKVTLYEGVLGEKGAEDYYEIQTYYRLEDRLKWNPHYKMSDNMSVNKDGYIVVKYLDGGE